MKTFWQNVAKVLTGTVLAQSIPLVGSLIIARQYAPAEFGGFAVWLGIVMVFGVALTGRFETALAIEPDGEPRRLAMLSTLVTACLSACFAVIVVSIATQVAPKFAGDLSPFMIVFLVPTALAIASAQTWQSWAAAEGKYRQLSFMRIAQAGTVTLSQISIGFISSSASGLALGHFLGILAGLGVSFFLMPTGTFPPRQIRQTILEFWQRHRRFPTFSLPADIINATAAQLPVLLVAGKFGAEIAGLLALTMRILGAPIGLLGVAVLDVFKRHAAASFRERGECRADYIHTFRVLALGSFCFCIVMALISEPFFALAFGEKWRGAGTIALWLLPLFALRFMASPLSYMVYIAGKQHFDLVWQIILLGMTFVALSNPQTYKVALQAYSAGYSLLYLIYLAMSYRLSLGNQR